LTISKGVDSVRHNVTRSRFRLRLGPRVWTGLILFMALAAAPALAQDATPSGSLTILSRPAGAACRIDGDRIITGRTPLVMERGLVGRYKVRSIEPGYEPWQRSINLSGATADTLWMELRAKSAWRAGFRSLIIPGWGQFYSDRSGWGWMWLGLAGLAGAGAIVANNEYQHRLDDIDAALSLKDRQDAIRLADDAYNERQAAIAVAAGVWIANSLDAMIFFPDRRTPLLGFDASRNSNGEIVPRLAVSVGF
jgi:hypothetical protein